MSQFPFVKRDLMIKKTGIYGDRNPESKPGGSRMVDGLEAENRGHDSHPNIDKMNMSSHFEKV